VVQLYTRYAEADNTRPARELKGFKRITLQPGECTTVTLCLHTNQLAFCDGTQRFAVHPGVVTVMVGDSSQHLPLTGTFEIVS
jgi:beta-glucosidase